MLTLPSAQLSNIQFDLLPPFVSTTFLKLEAAKIEAKMWGKNKKCRILTPAI